MMFNVSVGHSEIQSLASGLNFVIHSAGSLEFIFSAFVFAQWNFSRTCRVVENVGSDTNVLPGVRTWGLSHVPRALDQKPKMSV